MLRSSGKITFPFYWPLSDLSFCTKWILVAFYISGGVQNLHIYFSLGIFINHIIIIWYHPHPCPHPCPPSWTGYPSDVFSLSPLSLNWSWYIGCCDSSWVSDEMSPPSLELELSSNFCFPILIKLFVLDHFLRSYYIPVSLLGQHSLKNVGKLTFPVGGGGVAGLREIQANSAFKLSLTWSWWWAWTKKCILR